MGRKRPGRIGLAAAAALLLGACSSGGDGPDNTRADAVALVADTGRNMREAGTLRLAGSGTDDEGRATTMDLCVTAEQNLTGTLRQDGDTVTLVRVGPSMYIKAAPGYWGLPGPDNPAYARMEGKYVKVPVTESDRNNFWNVRDLGKLFDGRTDDVTRGPAETIDGTRVVPLTRTTDTGGTVSVYVPARGTPYVVLVRTRDGAETSDLRVRRTDDPCAPAEPPAGEVVLAEDVG